MEESGDVDNCLSSKVVASYRIQPEARTLLPTITDLSIVDATVVTYAAAAALWVYDAAPDASNAPSSVSFAESLSKSLTFYPHFAGQVGLTPYPVSGNRTHHSKRFRRATVSHGFPTDPGVSFEVAEYPTSAAKLFPDAAARSTTHKTWDLTAYNLNENFLDLGDMPVNNLEYEPDTPAVRIRMTRLSCRSIAIGVRIAHALADAETMIGFVRRWAAVHRALFSLQCSAQNSLSLPVFDPQLLDTKATGDIDMSGPDPELVSSSHSLPLPRFDWWTHERGRPAIFDESVKVVIPPEIPIHVSAARIPGARIPWEEWDMGAPVHRRILRFSAEEIEDLYSVVKACVLPEHPRISRHDVCMAFVWQLIALARPPVSWAVPPTSAAPTVFFDMTLGLRQRLGLPNNFVGSPILLAALEAPYTTVTGSSLPSTVSAVTLAAPNASDGGKSQLSSLSEHESAFSIDEQAKKVFPDGSALAVTAALVRSHINTFDRDAIGAWLHEQAFELAPQRWWNGFLGSRHVFGTSWVRAGIWDVDFGLAAGPKSWIADRLDVQSSGADADAPDSIRNTGNGTENTLSLVEAESQQGTEIPTRRAAALELRTQNEEAMGTTVIGCGGRMEAASSSAVHAAVAPATFIASTTTTDAATLDNQGVAAVVKAAPGLRWAGPMMPVLDSLVTITDAPAIPENCDWWAGGMDVDANLEASAMGRVLGLLDGWRARRETHRNLR